MKKVLVFALGALFCCSQAFAFDVSPTQINVGVKAAKAVHVNPDLLKTLFSNKSMSDGVDMLTVTEDGNRLWSLRGDLSSPLQGDLAKAAVNYVKENSKLFNLPTNRDADVLKVAKVREAAGGEHVALNMVMDGVKVYEANIELHMDKDGVVTLANGSFPTINSITNKIILGKYQAIGAAKVAVGADKFRAVPSAELQVYPESDGTGKMVYVTKLPVTNPIGDWKVLVDAETGDVVYMNNEMAFATGKGLVYKTNPLKCKPTMEDLLNLTAHVLKGKYVDALNEDTERASSENDKYVFDTKNTHFDEVNVYKNINQIHDFYTTLGFHKLDFSMKATCHKGDKYDNAYFSPWENAMYFGDGNRLNDLSLEAAVAFHEYSHGVINQIVRLNYSGESGAINEAQADYFGCTNTNDAKLGEWSVAKMGKPWMRNLEDNLHYPEDLQGEVHADGRIWGVTLWDIRKAIGAKAADSLIFNSHYYLKSGSPKFIDGYNALVTADKNKFGGKYKATLDKIFTARGIVAKNYNGAVLTKSDLTNMKTFMKVHNEL